MIRALTLGLLAAVATTSVMAADLIVEEPIAVEALAAAHDWNGAYVGVFAGYGSGNAEWGAFFDLDVPVAGWLAGGTVGANFQADSLVFGVEGDLAWSGIGGNVACPTPTFDCSTNINWLGTLRGRAGFAADAALLYVTAGLAVAAVDSATEDPPAAADVFSSTYVGWAAGAGVEFAVTDDVSIKAEYLYVDLGTQTSPAADLGAGADTPIAITAHTAKVGLNWGF